MAEIKASDVKALREKTGAGMMDCKNALVKAEGDFAKAEKFLKELGLAAVGKLVGRATNEGKIFAKVSGNKAVVLELSCETDFVARNSDFLTLGSKLAETILAKGYVQANDELNTLVQDVVAKIRENMGLKRFALVSAAEGEILHEYLHGDKLGVIVRFKADKAEALADEKVKAFIHDIALHIAAFNPQFVDRSRVSAEYLKEQEEIFQAQIRKDEKMKDKPANVLEGIVKGKVNKLMADICLLDQGFVKDEKQTVAKVMAELGKAVGANLSISDYLYYRLGE